MLLLCWLVALTLAPAARGQDDDEDPRVELIDPYTRFDPEAWAAAGYEPSRRFPFGDDHGTREVEELLGEVQLLWVETAHFRIGSSLPAHKLENDEKKAMKVELGRLRERLPKVKKSARVLDRWLRLHLYAMWLEETYDDFLGRLQLTDADFPTVAEVQAAAAAAEAARAAAAEREAAPEDGSLADAGSSPGDGNSPAAADSAPAPALRGAGPYLGMREKFCVLLLEKKSSLGRYCTRWGMQGPASPQRFNFHRRGCMGMATSWEFFDEDWKREDALRGSVTWSVLQMLSSSFKGYAHMPPAWFADGLSAWYQRRVNPRFPTFSSMEGSGRLAAKQWNWPPKVRARVKADYYPTLDEMLGWRRSDVHGYADHMLAWSRVDWLMNHDEGAFGRFMERLKDPLPVEPGVAPSEDDVEPRAREALELAWGMTPEQLDAAWAEWVLDTYPRK
ncbi:MAG: hypothetical protein DRQ55_03065 [Planctomycetota bacterium]|nr:MAG: hypothetical protein DRQ55_03065 [Planctomycetota bacterium]